MMKRLGIQEIKGICLTDNKASVKVMERCGFTKLYEGVGKYQGEDRQICFSKQIRHSHIERSG